MISENVTCACCGFKQIITLKVPDYQAWKDGAHIQDVAPYLSASEREMLISQTCETCWNEMFEGMEDE